MPTDPTPATRWALDDAVFGECRLGLEDFSRALRQEPRTRQLVQLATVLGAVALPAGLWLLTSGRRRLGALGCGLGLLGFAAYHLPDQLARRWFAHTPPGARLVKYTLNAQGLIITSELSRELHEYQRLYGYQQVPDSFLIWVSAKLFVILPKRAFAAQDLPRISARLEQQLGAPPLLPRFWRWLLLATLLAALLLGLWNRLVPR
jgi:predicted secreted protein